MLNVRENRSSNFVAPAVEGRHGIPSRSRPLLGKAIEALNAPTSTAGVVQPLVHPQHFRELVAKRAYYKAERRGFEPGHELRDWLEAEQEMLAVCAYYVE